LAAGLEREGALPTSCPVLGPLSPTRDTLHKRVRSRGPITSRAAPRPSGTKLVRARGRSNLCCVQLLPSIDCRCYALLKHISPCSSPTMQSEAPPDQGSADPQDPSTILPTLNQPHLQSERYSPIRTEPPQSTETLLVAGPQTTLRPSERSPLKRGSSRESDMHRSSTPPDGSSSGAIKYTRTGRVSKATKGQRVHQCDECGKVSYLQPNHIHNYARPQLVL